ncbi:hypothetical protein DAEQUDRAFT_745639 [Daedalea quercina L-15889]|uniref:Ubiquinol-cytochrome C reductase hinge domain-containing protein n=1 Tax=Daedalea quercina L-15889 TaxID=1314783 RepID=A0A165PSQ9_9APHY|nr:hypothetical protein DAEQUDRAFT_745639 [Daedalea quercina L-15889]
MHLSDMDDDTLILIFSFLSMHSILAMRQVLFAGCPFPHRRLVDMDAVELEDSVKRAIQIGDFWRSEPLSTSPSKAVDFHANSGTGVSDVRFLPGYDGRRLATLSKGIWSVITCWEVSFDSAGGRAGTRKLAEWCPKGTIITGLCIELLSLAEDAHGVCTFQSLGMIDTAMRPITLQGELLAYSDDSSRTVVTNWTTGAIALLQGLDEPVNQHFQYNRCLQVVFAHGGVLVVRARSVELFSAPALRSPDETWLTYRPLAYHSFGWIDGVSVIVRSHWEDLTGTIEPLLILLRSESDDPWMADVHTLDLYVLEPNPAYTEPGLSDDTTVGTPPRAPLTSAVLSDSRSPRSPASYLFPPIHSTLSSPSVRGFLRCTDIVLGPCGTAVWIQPRPARSVDLTTLDVHASETQGPRPSTDTEVLAGTAFTEPLRGGQADRKGAAESAVEARTLHVREAASGGNWTAMDYVEELGVVALASTQGVVTCLSSFFSSFVPTVYADAPPKEEEEHKEEETSDEPEESGEAEEEEEEEEPEDILPALREECEESAKCKAATEHFRHCEEKVNAGEGFKHEDCIEELPGCVAPKLFAKLK